MYLLLHLEEEFFKFCQGGFQYCRNKNLVHIFEIVSHSEDITGFCQLSTSFTLTLIIFGSRHDIKTLNKISVSTLLKTPGKFEVTPLEEIHFNLILLRRDKFCLLALLKFYSAELWI